MKKSLSILICIALMLGVSGCNRKEKENVIVVPDVKISDKTAKEKNFSETEEAAKTAEDEEKSKDKEDNVANEKNGEESSVESAEKTERTEIANNIRDIKTLIEEELYDDAEMIIDALRSRELTEEEEKEIAELEKMLEEVNK